MALIKVADKLLSVNIDKKTGDAARRKKESAGRRISLSRPAITQDRIQDRIHLKKFEPEIIVQQFLHISCSDHRKKKFLLGNSFVVEYHKSFFAFTTNVFIGFEQAS
jgi:hypothetical protein